jgi:hypothetical protein
MATRIRIPLSANDIDQVFRMRHTVYAEQGGYVPANPHGRLYDRFDALPGTVLMAAEIEGQMVGTVRFTRDLGAGTHANDYYDFTPHLPADALVGSGSQLAVLQEWHGRPRLTFTLVGMCIYHAAFMGLTHLLGTVNPEVIDGFLRLGFEPVDGVLTYEAAGLPFVPVVLRLDQIEGRIKAFVDRQLGEAISPLSDRLFFTPDECLRGVVRAAESYHVVAGGIQWVGTRGTKIEFGAGDYITQLDVIRGEPMHTAIALGPLDLAAIPSVQPRRAPARMPMHLGLDRQMQA